MKKYFLLSILIIALFSCGKGDKEIKTSKLEEVSGKIYKVTEIETDDLYEVSGTVTSKNPVNILAKIMGTVSKLNIEEGSFVKKGDLLILLDSPEITASLERATAAITEAEKGLEISKTNYYHAESTYRRYENLYKEKALSLQEFENFETKRNIAREEVKRLESSLAQAKAEKSRIEGMANYLKIFAPVDGVVTKKDVTLGMNIMPGMPLLTVETFDNLRIEINTDEKILPLVKKGAKYNVFFPSISKEFTGIVEDYVPAIDPLSRTFKIKLALPTNRHISIGMYGIVKIPMAKTKKIFVPKSAIYVKGQLNYVYAVDEKSIATMRLVSIGREIGNTVEILSGLKNGDKIIETVDEKIKDGVLIRG